MMQFEAEIWHTSYMTPAQFATRMYVSCHSDASLVAQANATRAC